MNILLAVILISAALIALAYVASLHWRALRQRDEYRHQRDREAEMHAACLSIAEGHSCSESDPGVYASLATRTVYKLRQERNELRAQATAAKAQLGELRSARNVAVRIHDKRMPSNEVKRAFAVADDAPLWIALNQEIDDYLLDIMDQVSLPPGQTMTEEIRTHVAGGVEYVRGLQKKLLELHAAAQKVDVDIEADEANPRQMR